MENIVYIARKLKSWLVKFLKELNIQFEKGLSYMDNDLTPKI
jgi:hypothetical protein